MALELASRGIRVAVLESGPRHDFSRRGEYVRRYLRHENPWTISPPTLDVYTVGGPTPYHLAGRRARGVGGSTLHWEGYALRLHASDFRLRSIHGVGEDWPISYQDLERYYGDAERMLGVAGVPDEPEASPRSTPYPLPAFAFSYSDGLFARACQTLGIAFHHLSQARNSLAYDGRAQGRASERVYPYRIGFSTAMSRQFAVAGDRVTQGAFLLEFLNSAGPTPERIAMASGRWGPALRQHVKDEFAHWLGIRVYAEQLPDRINTVSLNPRVRDYFGSPAPHIHYSVGRYERAAQNREGRKFCSQCGGPLATACSSCGFTNEPDEKFCGGCGQPLAAPSKPAAPPSSPSFASPESYTPKHLAERILNSKSAIEG